MLALAVGCRKPVPPTPVPTTREITGQFLVGNGNYRVPGATVLAVNFRDGKLKLEKAGAPWAGEFFASCEQVRRLDEERLAFEERVYWPTMRSGYQPAMLEVGDKRIALIEKQLAAVIRKTESQARHSGCDAYLTPWTGVLAQTMTDGDGRFRMVVPVDREVLLVVSTRYRPPGDFKDRQFFWAVTVAAGKEATFQLLHNSNMHAGY